IFGRVWLWDSRLILRLSMARATGCGRTASKGANFKLERKAGSCVPVLGQAFPHSNELSSFGRCKVTFISPLQPPIGPGIVLFQKRFHDKPLEPILVSKPELEQSPARPSLSYH